MNITEPGTSPESSMGGALKGRALKGSFHNESFCFELSDFDWDHAPRDEWEADSHLLDIALTPRPKPAWATFANVGHRVRQPVGRMMFVPAGRVLCSGAAVGRTRTLTCTMSSRMMEELLGRHPSFETIDVAEALHIRNPELEHLLLRVYQELRQPGFASELLIESLANAIAITLIRNFGLDKADIQAPRQGGLAPWRMRRIDERVHADAPSPDLAELAGICGISVRHLTRAFKAETGQTIAAFVQQVAIERAQTLLTETALPVAEIARRLGFSSSTSFCYAFRRTTGRRPSSVRALAGRSALSSLAQ